MESIESVLQPQNANARVYEVVLRGDEISWQTILFDLVKNQQMDPWAVDLSALTEHFLEVIHNLTETDFRINGKVVLAAAMLLKIKTSALLDHDINALDTLLASQDEMGMDGAIEDEGPRGRERIVVDGIPKVYPPLAKSDWLARNRQGVVRAVVAGLSGEVTVNGAVYHNQMPPVMLDDAQTSDVLTFVLNSWGNAGGRVTNLMYVSKRASSCGGNGCGRASGPV